jgi:hypothetical protein
MGFEPMHKGFADLSLTTWVPRLWKAEELSFESYCNAINKTPASGEGRS